MHLRLEPGPQRDQLGAIADQLAQLTSRGWRDPRLGQSTQAQHVDEIDRVAFVVLDPPRSPVQARRVREMDRRAMLLQPVDDPIPASITTSGSGPASATTAAIAKGSFGTRTEPNFSPSPFFRTITERRR
jgi:hypothetical protein